MKINSEIDTQQLNAEPACLWLVLVELYVWPQFTNPLNGLVLQPSN
jgi:hypothetical protein